MNSAAGFGNGLFSANHRGSVCPCGERMGRSRTVSYSFTATARAVVSAGKSRFASNIGFPYSSNSALLPASTSFPALLHGRQLPPAYVVGRPVGGSLPAAPQRTPAVVGGH